MREIESDAHRFSIRVKGTTQRGSTPNNSGVLELTELKHCKQILADLAKQNKSPQLSDEWVTKESEGRKRRYKPDGSRKSLPK